MSGDGQESDKGWLSLWFYGFSLCGKPDLGYILPYFAANVQSFRKQLAQEESASKAVKGLW